MKKVKEELTYKIAQIMNVNIERKDDKKEVKISEKHEVKDVVIEVKEPTEEKTESEDDQSLNDCNNETEPEA